MAHNVLRLMRSVWISRSGIQAFRIVAVIRSGAKRHEDNSDGVAAHYPKWSEATFWITYWILRCLRQQIWAKRSGAVKSVLAEVRAGENYYLLDTPSLTTQILFSQATLLGSQHTSRQILAGLQPC